MHLLLILFSCVFQIASTSDIPDSHAKTYEMAPNVFPLPGVEHGKRILTAVIEQRAKNDADSAWMSVPVDEMNLSLGYRDITFRQLDNAANHAAHWLSQNLPASEPFQSFVYAGPKDLRYSLLAVAAAKVQKVVSKNGSHIQKFEEE